MLRGQKLVWQEDSARSGASDLDREQTVIRGRNSWGRSWGIDGDFYLTLADLDILLARQGEAAVLEPIR
jgi:C1A family cysteine protease